MNYYADNYNVYAADTGMPISMGDEALVHQEVYAEQSNIDGIKAMQEDASKLAQAYKKLKWKIVLPFIIMTAAVSVSLGASLYAVIGTSPATKVNSLERFVTAETSKLNSTSNTLQPRLESVMQLRDSFSSYVRIGKSPDRVIRSCSQLPPFYPPGDYYINTSDGSSMLHYCSSPSSCYGGNGPWARVANLNMSDSSHQCPPGFRTHTKLGIRMCVRRGSNLCSGRVFYNMAGIEYSRVCGKIIGYQIGHPNAFNRQNRDLYSNTSTAYVDGVVLTHGMLRTHVWTFATAIADSAISPELQESQCSCESEPTKNIPPSFVGEDYFCDSGNRLSAPRSGDIFSDDPLWDGMGCGVNTPCCTFNSPPWFFRQLRLPTTDYIELRLCGDELSTFEDTGIVSVELYIQ